MVCKAKAVAQDVRACCERKSISIEDEARILGYPACCVAEYRQQLSMVDTGFFKLVERTGRGDIEEMKRLIRDDVGMRPETEEEIRLVNQPESVWAPFTSFVMCSSCQSDATGPAMTLSRKYEALATRIDASFANEVRFSMG